MAYQIPGIQQLADDISKVSNFGDNGWSYTFSLSELPEQFLTTITVYRRMGGLTNPSQIEVGHIDVNMADLAFLRPGTDSYINFVAEHVKNIVKQYELRVMINESATSQDGWFHQQAQREVETEYAAHLASLGVNLDTYAGTCLGAIINKQAELLKAQNKLAPNAPFLAQELSAMKHSFGATATREAQRSTLQPRSYLRAVGTGDYQAASSLAPPSETLRRFYDRQMQRTLRQTTPLARMRIESNAEREASRQRVIQQAEDIRRRERERILDEANDSDDDYNEDLEDEHGEEEVVVPIKAPVRKRKVDVAVMFEDTGRKFRID